MTTPSRRLLAIVAAFFAARSAAAQPAPHDTSRGASREQLGVMMQMGTWAIAPFVGVARHSPAGYNWGITPDRSHLMIGVHFATPVLRAGPVMFMYAPNVVPLVVVTNNPRYETVVSAGIPRRVETGRGVVYGAGLVPFGLQAEAKPGRDVDVYGMAGLGGVLFSDYMPQDGARRLNFSIEFGGGLIIGTRNHRAMQVGYKFYHLSNMYTARENPGVDAHVLYFGLRWQKRLPRE